METKSFIVKGAFKLGWEVMNFTKKVKASSENFAKHKVLCSIGSSYGLRRSAIAIDSVSEA